MAGKCPKKAEDSRYHDTWRLLKNYRDVVWSMELSVQQVKKEFEIEFGSTVDDFLESVYLAGADLGGTKIESHARCIERSNQMLTLLGNAVEILRTRHKNGETYYWILYYTYLRVESSPHSGNPKEGGGVGFTENNATYGQIRVQGDKAE